MTYGRNDIISVANMYFKPDSYITDDSYLLTYNIFELGDIAFEGNKSKNYAHGRFVENTIGNGIVSHVFDVFKPIMNPYDLLFWKYAINNERLMGSVLLRSTKASTMMTNLVATDFLQESFLVPTYPEQQKIGAFFQQLDHLITLHQRQPFLHSTPVIYPIAQLITVFYTSSWEQRKLGELALFNPKDELPQTFEYVDLESVVGTEMLSHRTEAKLSAPSRAQRLAHTGDLFYQTVRPYQRNNYLFEKPDNNYVFSTGYAQMRPYVDGYFLLSLVQSDRFVKVVLDNCTGTSYPAINANDLAEIEVTAPLDENEAQKIGTIFRNIDNLITLHQRKGKAAVSGCFLNCSSIEKVRR